MTDNPGQGHPAQATSRREAIKLVSATALGGACAVALPLAASAQLFTAHNRLAIPPLIDSRRANNDIQLAMAEHQHAFFPNKWSRTGGFGRSFLGPAIRLYRGDDTRLRFENQLREATSVHGHGLHVPGWLDGGPQSRIEPGETWDISLPIRQQASTNWYHPHLHGSTSRQVHSGLAGLYLIEDENSMSLPLPKDYGLDDIPLIVQDRDFEAGIMVPYQASRREMKNGKREDTVIVNGTVNPFVTVPKGWVRLRLLNGSNARFYEFHLVGGERFYKIATEGGFLDEPVAVTSLRMVPGERNEIMVNLSDGKTRQLLARMVPLDDDWLDELFPRTARVLQIRVDEAKRGQGRLPARLNTIERLQREDARVVRTFRLQMEHRGRGGHGMHAMFAINDKAMDPVRIDERVRKGDVEIWRIKRDEMDHPFHVHGTSFQILSQRGRSPRPADTGWKDTVEVDWGWTELIMKFEHEANDQFPFMYHCHILEHEDGGMMGQFTVT